MKTLLAFMLLFFLLYTISDIFVQYHSFGILPQKLQETLYGNEEEFIEAISTEDFLEALHINLFLTMMLLSTLAAIYVRVSSLKSRYMHYLLHTTLLGSVVSFLSLSIGFFVTKDILPLYSFSFSLWHSGAVLLAMESLIRIFYAKSL